MTAGLSPFRGGSLTAAVTATASHSQPIRPIVTGYGEVEAADLGLSQN
jgi:hypothetical protein